MKRDLVQWCVILAFVVTICLNMQAQDKVQTPKVKSLVVQEEEFGKASAGKRLESETSYDPSGNIIEEKQYKDGKLDSYVRNEYDKDGNKVKVTEMDDAGHVLKCTVYKYEKGLRTEKQVFGANQKIKSKKTYQYKFY